MGDTLNRDVATRLDEAAALLSEQGANPFRVRAYRRAAETLRALSGPVSQILALEGVEGLQRLPGIGVSLARAIRDIVRLGYLPMLERLRGEADPVRLLASVLGIGPRLAVRLHEEPCRPQIGAVRAGNLRGQSALCQGAWGWVA
jgi:putative hydrolase